MHQLHFDAIAFGLIVGLFYNHFYILIIYTKINSTMITLKAYGCLFILLNCVDWPLK